VAGAIELRKLTKYCGQRRGIEAVDLAVGEGEVFGFRGPNEPTRSRRSGSCSASSAQKVKLVGVHGESTGNPPDGRLCGALWPFLCRGRVSDDGGPRHVSPA
jgi:hypothetical protein